MQERYSLGKLPAEHLARLFAQYLATDERVIVGPGIGHDAAVISFSDRYLVAKTDPITFATDDIGWYAVHVNANDVACTGATARWFLATLLLPQSDTDEALVDEIFEQMADTCQQLGITLVGGHTEITHGFDRPIVAGFMLGEVAPEALVRPDGARPGDTLLLTKGIAVEGTALIAREKGDQLTSVDRSLVERSGRFLYEPGISVLATGLWELADAAQVGLTMDQDAIPILPETTTLCEALGLNPLGLIASGALLIVAPPDDAVEIQTALEGQNIPAARIGQVVKRDEGVKLHSPEGTRPLPRFDQDEITRLFE
jgi:hydrogenase expression/formation protein HypE